MDAGTVRAGIDKAIEKGVFSVSNETVLKDYIKGYFISHGHLDHLSGMIINSPDDSKKNIYSIPETAEILKNRYFTNDAGSILQMKVISLLWANILTEKWILMLLFLSTGLI